MLLPGLKVHAAETLKSAERCGGHSRMTEVELHDLVSSRGATIGDVNRDVNRAVCRYALIIDARVAVGERRVAESIAERIECFAIKVAVGALGHRVVLERRKLIDRFVESNWQSPAGIEVTGEGIGNCGAAFFSWIPRF